MVLIRLLKSLTHMSTTVVQTGNRERMAELLPYVTYTESFAKINDSKIYFAFTEEQKTLLLMQFSL